MIEFVDISVDEKARIYGFLKIVFATEPSLELLMYLKNPKILDSLRSTGVYIINEDFSESHLPKLKKDYTQLFIGPGKHIALNESIYTEKTPQFWGESAVQMKKFVEYAGLELDESWTQMPDHISVEFELMQKLLEANIAALKINDSPTSEKCCNAINQLFNDHIVKWVPQVCDQIIVQAKTFFYKAISTWTKQFISSESDKYKF